MVGVPDERYGEEICAVVILKEGRKMTEADFKTFCKERMAHFKIPRYVMFKDESYIPMTATGKAQKVILRDKCAEEIQNQQKQA